MLEASMMRGPRLRRLRFALEYPEQKPFAKALGLGKSTYSEIEESHCHTYITATNRNSH
jgi:transcriptional regulator with XRE-family HTH domain